MENVDNLVKILIYDSEPFKSIAYTRLKQNNVSDLDIVAKAIELGYLKRESDQKPKRKKTV